MGKRGQMKLSFGMIFSIFLIIIFIAFAFYAIKKLLVMQQNIQIESFINDLQNDVKTAWKSSKTGDEFSYSLPNKIKSVCFEDDEFDNLVFRPPSEKVSGATIEHLDISKITIDEDVYCILNTDGKVKLIISKDYGEDLVTITRE